MKLIGNEPRIKVNVFIDPDFKAFLQELKTKENTSISLLLERATIEKFSKEYEEFIEIYRENK